LQVKYKEVDWSEAGLKTEEAEAWAEYDEPADLTTHQVAVRWTSKTQNPRYIWD
jgi:hypothetical protein